MLENQFPRLRNVNKVVPPYQLNTFPKELTIRLGESIVYLIATKSKPVLEGSEWEEIFAYCVNADWKPSNVGLDDVVLQNCAWGAKTVKANNPHKQKTVRLISGRNSPVFSYGIRQITEVNPNELGEQILGIWNERVSSIREKYKFVRTVVLIKSNDLLKLTLFEFNTVRYDPQIYIWKWNKRNNLEGYNQQDEHIFTWQPHGSQFTIIESVPENALKIKIKKPIQLNKSDLLEKLGFDESWVTIIDP